MDLTITFPGGLRVDAQSGPFTISTDQPVKAGGEASAPTPFVLFLASLGTCAGIYVLGFCKQRGLPTDGIRLVERLDASTTSPGMIGKVTLEIQVPSSFPEKYHEALIRVAEQCTVKKHLETPPAFEVKTSVV
jgi:putative redox protein